MATIKNGINVDNLKIAIEGVKNNPSNGKLEFTVNSKWKGGFKAKHTTADYVVGKESGKHEHAYALSTDEPKEILGTDSGISPAETLLSSLAACLTVGYAANAAAMEIDIEEMSFEITGNGNLEGFMNLGDRRPGLSDISVKAHIKSNTSREKLQELHDYVNKHSPIWDTILSPISVKSVLAA